MKKILGIVVGVLWLSTASIAQDTNSEVGAQPNAEIKQFQDWNVQCVLNADGLTRNCALFHQVNLDSGQRFMVMQVSNRLAADITADPEFVTIITTPLGVHLPSGVRVQVDNGTPLDLIYERCDQQGCYAGINMNEGFTTSLIKGNTAKVSFNDLSGKTLTTSISLKGFTAGFSSI